MHYNLSGLADKTGIELCKAVKVLPFEAASLDLSKNNLGKLPHLGLVLILKTIPRGLSSLDLSENFLYQKTGTAFKALPAGLTSLNLRGNALGFGFDIAEYFKTLPIGLISLDLSDNFLSFTEIGEAFKALPASITLLNLRGNNLNFTSAELAEFFKVLPVGLHTLDLRNNYINILTDAELAQAFKALPVQVTSVILDSKTIDPSKFIIRQELQAKLELQLSQKLQSSQEIQSKQELQAMQPLQAQKESVLTSLEPQFLVMEAKVVELKNRSNCETAYKAANLLYETLIGLKEYYARGLVDYLDFKKQSIKAIDTARTELEKHRGWKEILANVALCILGIGIGYLAVCAYNGGFFKFNTDSVNKLDVLQTTIEAATPAA